MYRRHNGGCSTGVMCESKLRGCMKGTHGYAHSKKVMLLDHRLECSQLTMETNSHSSCTSSSSGNLLPGVVGPTSGSNGAGITALLVSGQSWPSMMNGKSACAVLKSTLSGSDQIEDIVLPATDCDGVLEVRRSDASSGPLPDAVLLAALSCASSVATRGQCMCGVVSMNVPRRSSRCLTDRFFGPLRCSNAA